MIGVTPFLRKNIPKALLKTAQAVKVRLWRLVHPQLVDSAVPLEEQFPYCSPNVWERMVDYYQSLSQPIIFEYGTGVSSLWHIRNLVVLGGTYIGVEHQLDWYVRGLAGIMRYAFHHRLTMRCECKQLYTSADSSVAGLDTCIKLSGPNVAGCTVKLRFRSSHNRTQDPDGTLSEFREYILALDESIDMVIVDGRARKACVNYVLDTDFLRPGGLLVLFEAWRGMNDWMGHPRLTGTSDYQPEVQRMLALGGELVDGIGFDRWPKLKRRRTIGSTAHQCPAEACFWRKPGEQNHI